MKRVLIADDEPIERMIVTRTIQKYFPEELAVVSAVMEERRWNSFLPRTARLRCWILKCPE